MSTSSIDRTIIISDPEAIDKIRNPKKEVTPKFQEILRKAATLKENNRDRKKLIQKIIKKY